MKPNDTIKKHKQAATHDTAQQWMIYRISSGRERRGEARLGKGKSRATTPPHEYV